ncbi:MAG TPA: MFS transporter [Gemmataceae bacterium]|nr:MFS transporter [Gemmataceae bacterium]
MSGISETPPPQRLGLMQWLIVIVATIGFAFDTYALLTTPLIARPALAQLLPADPATREGAEAIARWTGYIFYASAVSGGIFGLLGGYLTDRFGRRAVLVWSILLYAFSSLACAYATSPMMLLVLRCTTFIGVCVEFVAAVAWLAELFPNPQQRETVLGFTQAFSSIGGLMVTGTYWLAETYAPVWNEHLGHLLPGVETNNAWRWTLISGLIPALPVMLIRPFLPESPAWKEKKERGTLKRPSFGELFQPAFRTTTLVTTAMFACSFGAAFGAIQLTPQMVPGLVPEAKEIPALRKELASLPADSAEAKTVRREIISRSQTVGQVAGSVQFCQELGGLVGRFALAWLALWIVSRRTLIRVFQVPGLLLIPLVYLFPATGKLPSGNLEVLKVGLFVAGFFTVSQFSFWGNYLPRMYPTYLRGTGESFSANVGGRMLGTTAALVTTQLAPFIPSPIGPHQLAYAAAAVVFLVYALGLILSFWLPEPKQEALPE